MSNNYDEKSFWAGVVLGRQMRGWSAYGRPEGFDPDGDLIVRPIIQGVPMLSLGKGEVFTVRELTDTVGETWPEMELQDVVQELGVVVFGEDRFALREMAERLVIDQVIQAFTVSKEINPLEYDDAIVFINGSGAFTMDSMTRTFTSAEQAVDIGTMQEVTVATDEFAEVTEQEVSA